jgi:hypothetical protein
VISLVHCSPQKKDRTEGRGIKFCAGFSQSQVQDFHHKSLTSSLRPWAIELLNKIKNMFCGVLSKKLFQDLHSSGMLHSIDW